MKHLYLLLFLTAAALHAQDTIKDPINGRAFNKQLMQELNFMVLGDNNLNQGVSYELDDKRTELSLKAGLSNRRTYIVTIDGSFSVDDGVFILDNEDGSKKGKIAVNLFFPAFKGNYKTFPATEGNSESGLSNRLRHVNYIQEKELKQQAVEKFMVLDTIMRVLNFPRSTVKKEKTSFLESKQERQNNKGLLDTISSKKISDKRLLDRKARDIAPVVSEKTLVKALSKYYVPKIPEAKFNTFDSLVTDIMGRTSSAVLITGEKDTVRYEIYEGLDVDSLFMDYNRAVIGARDIDDKIDNQQIKNFSELWLWHTNTYFSLSPYYERESLETYSNDMLITDFSKRFLEERGDLYGLTAGLNWVKRHREGIFFMARGHLTLGRATNFSDFKKREYLYTSASEPIGTGNVVEEQRKTAYYTVGNIPYQYGFLQQFQAEAYVAWKAFGLYGKAGYRNNDALSKKESYPFETGIMINLKSDKKNVVSMLIFMARQDLEVHPDDDMNFGFKIGLPINMPNKKEEKLAGTK